jgi:hypothetical protein
VRNSHGGWSAIFVDKNINHCPIIFDENVKEEITGITIEINNKETAIIYLYNLPAHKLNIIFLIELENKYENLLILGDLNAKMRSQCDKYNQNGKKLNMLQTGKMSLLNRNNKQTSYWKNSITGEESNSLIDLSIVSDIFN